MVATAEQGGKCTRIIGIIYSMREKKSSSDGFESEWCVRLF